jgi:hypothetical protein
MEERMIKKCFLFPGWIALLFLLMSCAGPGRLETDFGNSSKLSKINQIYDPEAEKNTEPVAGLDGKAAEANTEKYRKDFEKPAQPVPSALTIGNSSSGKK